MNLTLMSFIWPDHPTRMARLREGLAVYRTVSKTAVPIHLHPLNLPAQLPDFLAQRPTNHPTVIYNTYITQYLADKGASMLGRSAVGPRTHPHPVLWLQWEPPRDGRTPSTKDWCAWDAHLWVNGHHRHWHLAWIHPHGTAATFLPGWSAWCSSGE